MKLKRAVESRDERCGKRKKMLKITITIIINNKHTNTRRKHNKSRLANNKEEKNFIFFKNRKWASPEFWTFHFFRVYQHQHQQQQRFNTHGFLDVVFSYRLVFFPTLFLFTVIFIVVHSVSTQNLRRIIDDDPG